MQRWGSIYILAAAVSHQGNTVVLWRVCFGKKLRNWANASLIGIRRVAQNGFDWFSRDESVAPRGARPFSFVSRIRKIVSGLKKKDSSDELGCLFALLSSHRKDSLCVHHELLKRCLFLQRFIKAAAIWWKKRTEMVFTWWTKWMSLIINYYNLYSRECLEYLEVPDWTGKR